MKKGLFILLLGSLFVSSLGIALALSGPSIATGNGVPTNLEADQFCPMGDYLSSQTGEITDQAVCIMGCPDPPGGHCGQAGKKTCTDGVHRSCSFVCKSDGTWGPGIVCENGCNIKGNACASDDPSTFSN